MIRTLFIIAALLAAWPAAAHKVHHNCNYCEHHYVAHTYVYRQDRDGGYRAWEGPEMGVGDSWYGENGGTTLYGE